MAQQIGKNNMRTLRYMLLACFNIIIFGNGNNQEIFLRAHKLYEQKEIEQAYALYQSIENKGSAVWYNMGNCNYKLGKFLEAYACWHQAKKNATAKEFQDILYNID